MSCQRALLWSAQLDMMRPEVSESCESVTADGEAELVALALGLGAGARGGAGGLGALSAGELALVRAARARGLTARAQVAAAQAAIDAGEDPLGEAFCRLRSPVVRRPSGATYTPLPIVRAMVDWAAEQGAPTRVVDPGAGSGRFAKGVCQRIHPWNIARLRPVKVRHEKSTAERCF